MTTEREDIDEIEFGVEGEEPAPWPTITLPEDRRKQLQAKLKEYRARMQEGDAKFKHPDLLLLMGSDAATKATILERLLRDGKVDTRQLMGELRDRLGDMYNPLTLINPILVIQDYCRTGGTHAVGGTGLPTEARTDPNPTQVVKS
jgi:hypothetical protein